MREGEDASHNTVEADSAAPQFSVGARLQAVRRARGLSQRELARRANVTNGNLSLIEQGKVSPSLASLEKILKGVPMSLPEFFAETAEVPVVHPAEEWMQVKEGAAQMRLMCLTDGGRNDFQLVDCSLPARACEASGSLFGGHSGLIAGMVLEGHLELRLDGICHELGPGDGFQFTGCRGRQFANKATESCRFVLFVQITR